MVRTRGKAGPETGPIPGRARRRILLVAAVALVDEALGREHCLFPVNGSKTPFGPSLEVPYGPPEQSDAVRKIPLVLERRGRVRLSEGHPREAIEDVRRMLLSVRQAMTR